MRSQRIFAVVTTLAITAGALAQTVTVRLTSDTDGQAISPGATVDWMITFEVSQGDNEGLALLVCDLIQNGDNTALLDIPPADGVPTEMDNFSRPNGISNPGESDPVTGYIGVQRGESGAMNLIQVGGAQNTFGEAMSSGSGIAENANVLAGVGQSSLEVLASGSFTAPTACGTYTFELADISANVIEHRYEPPVFSPVVPAEIEASMTSFSFTIALSGDLDLDGDVDLADLAELLGNYGETSGMTYEDGDLDGDGDVDLSDLAELLGSYGDTCE